MQVHGDDAAFARHRAAQAAGHDPFAGYDVYQPLPTLAQVAHARARNQSPQIITAQAGHDEQAEESGPAAQPDYSDKVNRPSEHKPSGLRGGAGHPG